MKSTSIKTTFAALAFVIAGSLTPVAVHAAGTATYSLSQSGNTVSIYESSATAVNTVQVNLSYSSAQPVSVTPGSTFPTCINPSVSSIPCSALGGSITGSNLVATLNFANTTAASLVSVLTSSAIYDSTTNADVLDHTALPTLSYSYTAAAATPPATTGTTTTSTTGTKTTSSSSNNGTVAGSTTTTPSTPSTPTNSTSGSKSTTKTSNNSTNNRHNNHRSWRDTAITSSSVVLLVVLVGGAYWALLRRRAPVVVPVTYKVGKKAPGVASAATKSKSTTRKNTASKTARTTSKSTAKTTSTKSKKA